MCLARGGVGVEGCEWMRGLGLGFTNQSCGNRGSVGRVFGLRWCGWCRWAMGRGLGPGSGCVGLCYVCVRCESVTLCRWQFPVSVYCDWRIPTHIRCTQCSILFHLMDICFLTCICLWQISQIQTYLCVVVGPGFVSTSSAFMRNSASHPDGPHGRLAQKRKSGPHFWGRDGSTQLTQQFVTAVTAPQLVGYVVWSLTYLLILFIPMWDIMPQCHFSTFYGLKQSLELPLKSDLYQTVRL